MKIISVVGARPNFMKIAPFVRAIESHNQSGKGEKVEHILVHTGQHYDVRMSEAFFNALNIPDPDINLEIGSGSHAEQVGNTMIAFEKVLQQHKPDWVVVVGDVNATLACSVTAKKENIKVCHIEAGLRSGDMAMPEEINRLVTDRLSDLLLTPDTISAKNLEAEGVPAHKMRFVGNIMIDTLEQNRKTAAKITLAGIIQQNAHEGKRLELSGAFPIKDNAIAVLTLHRPSNVDHPEVFKNIVEFLISEVCAEMPLLWAIHPRAEKRLKEFGLWDDVCKAPNLILLRPLGYHDMLRLNMASRIMLTDSGGLQEECTVLGTPCLTLRWNTERPVTLKEHGGASVLVGNNIERIRKEYRIAMTEDRHPVRPELWDGHAAERCLAALLAKRAS
ncbi:MAG: non-hydrolyzing UDP-N-acetylglucosamine 2-epimerase [Bacteroidales bacterium]